MTAKQKTQLNPFEKLYNRELNPDELAEMKHNFFGVMDLLLEIDKERKQSETEGGND